MILLGLRVRVGGNGCLGGWVSCAGMKIVTVGLWEGGSYTVVWWKGVNGVNVTVNAPAGGWLFVSLSLVIWGISGPCWVSWGFRKTTLGSGLRIWLNHKEVLTGVSHFWNSTKYFPTTLHNWLPRLPLSYPLAISSPANILHLSSKSVLKLHRRWYLKTWA